MFPATANVVQLFEALPSQVILIATFVLPVEIILFANPISKSELFFVFVLQDACLIFIVGCPNCSLQHCSLRQRDVDMPMRSLKHDQLLKPFVARLVPVIYYKLEPNCLQP